MIRGRTGDAELRLPLLPHETFCSVLLIQNLAFASKAINCRMTRLRYQEDAFDESFICLPPPFQTSNCQNSPRLKA